MKQTDSNINASFWEAATLQVRYTHNFQQQPWNYQSHSVDIVDDPVTQAGPQKKNMDPLRQRRA